MIRMENKGKGQDVMLETIVGIVVTVISIIVTLISIIQTANKNNHQKSNRH